MPPVIWFLSALTLTVAAGFASSPAKASGQDLKTGAPISILIGPEPVKMPATPQPAQPVKTPNWGN